MARDTAIKIAVSEDMKDKLDWYAQQMGMTRSGLGAYIIGNWVFQQEQVVKPMIDKVTSVIDQTVLSEIRRNVLG